MPRPPRETPYGKTETGDRILWARVVGKFGSQEDLAELAGLGRLDVQALESGRTKGNSRKVTDALGKVFGQPFEAFQAYLEGAYGPPSKQAAQQFLGGDVPPNAQPAEELPKRYLTALGHLSLTSERNFVAAARAHWQGAAAHRGNEMDEEVLARQIAELDADMRTRAAGALREASEPTRASRRRKA